MVKSEYLLSLSKLKFSVISPSPPSTIIPSPDPSSGPINPILSLKSCSTAEGHASHERTGSTACTRAGVRGEHRGRRRTIPLRPLSFLMRCQWTVSGCMGLAAGVKESRMWREAASC